MNAPSLLTVDVAVVGAGIAGVGLAAELAPHASVAILEAEAHPGYHATGRSAAFWSETYGGPGVQPLTSASGPALRDGGFLQPLGSLHIGHDSDRTRADAFLSEFRDTGVALNRVDPAGLVPGLRPDWTVGVLEPSCAYIDAAALLADGLSRARRGGAVLLTGAPVVRAERTGGAWTIETPAGTVRTGVIVDAAGAWADALAALCGAAPLGIRPYRRTMAQLRVDPPVPPGLPHVIDLAGGFYFKPEPGGRVWLSPHDETPCEPRDAAPEELDVALAIDRFERAVDWRIVAVERRWAGLRSFAPDRLPVYGLDASRPGFFWCAGQGGFGLQTAPAASALAAALLIGHEPPVGVDAQRYAPGRFG